MYSFMIVLQFDNTDKKYRINSKILIYLVKPTRNVMVAMATSSTRKTRISAEMDKKLLKVLAPNRNLLLELKLTRWRGVASNLSQRLRCATAGLNRS